MDERFVYYNHESLHYLQPDDWLPLQVQYSRLCSSIMIELYSHKGFSEYHQITNSVNQLHEALLEWKNNLKPRFHDIDKECFETSAGTTVDDNQYVSLFCQFHAAMFFIHRYWEKQSRRISESLEPEAKMRSRQICLSSARASLTMAMQSHQVHILSNRWEPQFWRV